MLMFKFWWTRIAHESFMIVCSATDCVCNYLYEYVKCRGGQQSTGTQSPWLLQCWTLRLIVIPEMLIGTVRYQPGECGMTANKIAVRLCCSSCGWAGVWCSCKCSSVVPTYLKLISVVLINIETCRGLV